jgi:hypothetical protein
VLHENRCYSAMPPRQTISPVAPAI